MAATGDRVPTVFVDGHRIVGLDPLGYHVVKPGLQAAPGRGHGFLPVEVGDGAFKLPTVIA